MAKGSRGLSSLFEDGIGETAVTGKSTELLLSEIFPNPDQPRKAFDENAMNDLTSSIREHGVISPIVVNRQGDGTYMIVAGERRYRAARRAGLERVPVIIRDLDEKRVRELALIENLQREDLNPIEAAYAMKRLMEDYGLTQEALAEQLGKSRPAIANTLRLLTLSEEVIELVRAGKLSSGHARTLVPLPKDVQLRLAEACIKNGYSVRETERAVKQELNPPEAIAKSKERKTVKTSAELKHFVERLRTSLGTKVSLIGTEKKGRIYIDYYSRDDLERISDLLDILDNIK